MKNTISILLFWSVLITMTVVSCKKEIEYPMVFINITATDCTYTKSGEDITFKYAANHPEYENYKRGLFIVTCKRSNIKELIKHPQYANDMFKYIRVDTAWFVSYDEAYLAK